MPTESTELPAHALDQLFLAARTHNGWADRPVTDETLQRLYDIARMGPTLANTSPMRVVFVRSPAAKERLKPTLMEGNVAKTMAAPATAIIAHDIAFHTRMTALFPERGAQYEGMFGGMPEEARAAIALHGGTLEGAYLILAARSLGLDCGPMGGFDKAKCDAEFFAGTTWRSNFLVNLGYGDPAKLMPRNPRLPFAEAAKIL